MAIFGPTNGEDGAVGIAQESDRAGIVGRNDGTANPPPGTPGGAGVFGLTVVPTAAGVFGANNNKDDGVGVQGNGPDAGVSGYSGGGTGVLAHSDYGDGSQSFAHAASANGVLGQNVARTRSKLAPLPGAATPGPHGNGVYGYTDVPGGSGLYGAVALENHDGAGVTGVGPVAGHFIGNVVVTGDIQLGAADYAEDFDLSGPGTPDAGSVMVLTAAGEALAECDTDYDGRVAGIVCGAGAYRPGVILDRRPTGAARVPIALVGKVYCKVDATAGAIRTGDVLTTSSTPGHAMRATDRDRAFGAVIGKALGSLDTGRGLIPVLVSLQ